MKLIIEALKGNITNQTPIWLMRQAGRYLPEYREVRKKAGSFLNLCYNPELASEVTIQPIKRFGFDAAIIFSDILIVPDILGIKVEFLEGEGPKLENIHSKSDIKKLSIKYFDESEKMRKVCEAISITKSKLDQRTALIGFAGSPWTVATYIISKTKHDFDFCREFSFTHKEIFQELIDIITDQTIIYLKAHIKAGAEIIQIFDSWAGVLPEEEYYEYVIKPNKKIVDSIKNYNKNIPIIGFPKGSGVLYENYINNIDVNAVSIDHNIPLGFAKKIQQKKVLQGNLDPIVMLCDKELIRSKVDDIMENLSGKSFIFNLGHGIDKRTPIENVEFLVNYVRDWKK